MLNKRWIVCNFYFALNGIQFRIYKLTDWAHWAIGGFPCILLWEKKRAEVSAGKALSDVKNRDGVSHLLSQGHVHVQNLALPQAPALSSNSLFAWATFMSLCCFAGSESIICVASNESPLCILHLHFLASSTGKRNWKGFPCYWFFMDPTLQTAPTFII